MKLIGIFLVLSVPFAASVIIDCEFTSESSSESSSDNCLLRSDPNITERSTVVTAATEKHEDLMNHANVTRFWSLDSNHTINYMPRLSNVFPNLERIRIQSNHLKEIRQADLQPYPKLKQLNLENNDIEIIEPDLFKFNPLLQRITLRNNKIKRVDPKVFDHLKHLANLDMINTCVSESAGNPTEVKNLITKIQQQCSDVIPPTNIPPSDQANSTNKNANETSKVNQEITTTAPKNGNIMTTKLHLVMKYSILLMFIYAIFKSQ
jgi:hypothetical protein